MSTCGLLWPACYIDFHSTCFETKVVSESAELVVYTWKCLMGCHVFFYSVKCQAFLFDNKYKSLDLIRLSGCRFPYISKYP